MPEGVFVGRVVKRGPQRAPVRAATLLAPRPLAGDVAPRPLAGDVFATGARAPVPGSSCASIIRMMGDVTPANVRMAPSLIFLRIRARDVRAYYVRLWHCLFSNRVMDFGFDVFDIEADGHAHGREVNLLAWIKSHEDIARVTYEKIQDDAAARSRWEVMNRGGSQYDRDMRARAEAVKREIRRRMGDGTLRTLSLRKERNGTVEQGVVERSTDPLVSNSFVVGNTTTPVVDRSTGASDLLYFASHANDIARVTRGLEAEETGAGKSNRNESLAAARAAAFDQGDMAIAQSLGPQEQKRRESMKKVCQRKRVSEAAFLAYIREYYMRDTNSADERS